jgi:hypothetical protein
MHVRTRLVIRLYPRAWQRRYAAEVLAHVGPAASIRDAADLCAGALRERWRSGRLVRPLAEGAALVLLPGLIAAIRERDIAYMNFSLVVALLATAATLAPAAGLCAALPRVAPRWAAVVASAVVAALVAYRIGGDVTWIVAPGQIAIAAAWVGGRVAARAEGASKRQIA